ncbi:phage recombination protein Bet [Hyphomonas sp.]|uniref:phage recombination protein Bet n=1 Tax=Hyphomonas sp. TaxID=87 RepID=UPI0030019CD5
MTALVQHHQGFTPAQLDIIRKTCAPETNNDEFNLFIESAKGYGLNPMKRQIMAMVFSPKDPKKRRMSLIVEIGGLRAIASRSGRYRPAGDPTAFEMDAEKTATNPLGISRAVVTVFKQDDRGQWHPVVGEAWWDEHADVTDEWAWNDQAGKRQPTGKKTLSNTWGKMPRLMIAKCAEAQALRKGWPEDIGGLYEQAESGGVWDENMLPTEAIEAHATEVRQQMIGKRAGEYAIQFAMGEPIQMIAPGQIYDRIAEYVRGLDTTMEVRDFRARNKEALRRLWGDDKDAGLSISEMMDARTEELEREAENEAA